jgi:hypothetical protein
MKKIFDIHMPVEDKTPLDRTRCGNGNGTKYVDLGSLSYQPQGVGATRSDAERSKRKGE